MVETRRVGDLSVTGGWKDGEYQLRSKEVATSARGIRLQTWIILLQAAALVAVAISAGSAALSARSASKSVQVAADSVDRTTAENRLSTAISAIGGSGAPERVAGLELLRRAAVRGIADANTPLKRRNAFDLYLTSLDIIANYLHAPPSLAAAPAGGGTFGRGYGTPTRAQLPLDVVYAADQLAFLIDNQDSVQALGDPRKPGLDLSGVELYGQRWTGLDVSWFGAAYFGGIDLRDAILSSARFGRPATLSGGYLQCATAQGTDFRGSTLERTDFRGADLAGADFTGADLKDARFDGANLEGAHFDAAQLDGASFNGVYGNGVYGTATGLAVAPTSAGAAQQYDHDGCVTSGKYWVTPR